MTKRKTTGSPKQVPPNTNATKPSSASVDSMLDSISSAFKGQSAYGGLLGGIGQITSASMIRTQLERIADAMELETLDHLCAAPVKGAQQRLNDASNFLRNKILARVEREKAAAETPQQTMATVSK